MSLALARASHLVGLVLWFASLLVVSRLVRAHARAPADARGTLHGLARRMQVAVGWPGLILTWGGGLALLGHGGGGYFRQGWFHVMLTAGLLAVVLEVVLFVLVRRAAAGPVRGPAPMVVHGLAGVTLIVTILVAELGVRFP